MAGPDLEGLRALVGTEFEPATYDVSRQDILRFCGATGDTRAVHTDPEAARRAGHRDLVAPTAFYAALGFARGSLHGRSRLGLEGLPLDPALAGLRIVAGETRARFHGPILAGDRIVVRQRLVDVTLKQGSTGQMAVLGYERTYERIDRRRSAEVVVVERYARIARA